MKKVLCVIAVLAMVLTLGTTAVFADAAELKGATIVSTGTWDGNVAREADGDSVVIGPSGDGYGFIFENVKAGIYKIAYYLDLDSTNTTGQMRISPQVTMDVPKEDGTTAEEMHRCWVDFPVANVTGDWGETEGKVVLVAVINVAYDAKKIDVGAWQDANTYVGKLDKVVLVPAEEKDFADGDGDYALGAENGCIGSFGEDAEGMTKVIGDAESGWEAEYESLDTGDNSTATEAPATEAPATEAPATEAPATEAPATEAPATEAPATTAPAATSTADADTDADGGDSTMIIVIVVVAVVVIAAIVVVVLKKKKK